MATRRRITEQGVVYALIRLGKTMPAISVLLNQYLDKIPADRLDTVINSPLPARDSWLIHRACWEGNVDVVRAIVNRGAITNRLNEYNEHPAEVLVQGVAQNGVSQASKEKILEILVNTLLRGAKDGKNRHSYCNIFSTSPSSFSCFYHFLPFPLLLMFTLFV